MWNIEHHNFFKNGFRIKKYFPYDSGNFPILTLKLFKGNSEKLP